MSRRGFIALIIIAILTVAGGVYWYAEFAPLASFGREDSSPAVALESYEPAQEPVKKSEPQLISDEKEVEREVEEEIQIPSVHQPIEESKETLIPPTPVTYSEKEVEVTIIPFDDLEHFFESEFFALSEKKSERAEVAQEPLPAKEEQEVPPLTTEDHVLPTEEESEPLVAAHELPIIEQLPTFRLEHEVFDPRWEGGISLGIPHWSLPSFSNNGFAIDAQFFHYSTKNFRWGGAVGGRKAGDLWSLDLMGGVRWSFDLTHTLSATLSTLAGPSVRFATQPEFGLLARVGGGLSLSLLEGLALSLEATLITSWYVGDSVTFALEAPRLSFLFSF